MLDAEGSVERNERVFKRLKSPLLVMNFVAMVAVLVVVAGPPVYAKSKALLTGADIQDSSLTGADVRDSSLTGADIQDGSLTKNDLSGPVPGITPKTRTVEAEVSTDAVGSFVATAKCNVDEYLVTGGSDFTAGNANDGFIIRSLPVDIENDGYLDQWIAKGYSSTTTKNFLRAFAYCAPLAR